MIIYIIYTVWMGSRHSEFSVIFSVSWCGFILFVCCNPHISVCGPAEWFLVFNLRATVCRCMNGVSEMVAFQLDIGAISELRSKPSVRLDNS